MAEGDGEDEREEVEEVEAPPEDTDSQEEALLHFGRYSDMRRALPWEQKTRRERVNYYLDRCFLAFLLIFFLVLIGEFSYKMWYVTNLKKIKAFVLDFMAYVLDFVAWLLTQDEEERMAEL